MKKTSELYGRPLLTIAIPTYNRANYLRGSLTTLFDQLIDEPNVELIISDNASTDETPAVIEEFQKRGLALRYLRNEVNIGLDGNFLQCYEQSAGKYLWLLGDDDVLLPEALGRILPWLAANDYSLLCLCVFPFHTDYLSERTHDRFQRFAQTVPNGLPFIQKIGTMITFISSMIVNKDKCGTERIAQLQTLVGCDLMHLGWLLPVLEAGGTDLIVWEKFIAGRNSYASEWSICQVFGHNLVELLSITLPDRKDIFKAIVDPTLMYWFPTMILQVRRPGSDLKQEDFRNVLGPLYNRNWRYWFFVFPVVAFPFWAARWWCSGTQLICRVIRVLLVALRYPSWRKDLVRAPR
jgi:glycosyltransferase involved in cell wall biosynthesis